MIASLLSYSRCQYEDRFFLSNTTAPRSTKHLRKSRQKEALLSYIAHHCRMRECHMKEICAEFQITGLWLWLQSRLESALKNKLST